jgi:hypothetical protein
MSKFALALLLGLSLGVHGGAAGAWAQEFKVEDAASVEALAVDKVKPREIAFFDRPGEKLLDASTGFVKFEDWARERPVEKEFLALYPGYNEPDSEIIIDGARRRVHEKLHMYVGEARFVLARQPASLNLASLATLPFVEQIDPAIKHKQIAPAELARPKEPRTIFNQDPKRRWCEERPIVICIRSTYRLEGRLPIGIALANKIREGSKKISDTLEFDSEVTVLSPSEVATAGLSRLTGLNTPAVGALEQSIFYINQVMQFGKLVAVFQSHPSDAGKTVVTVFISIAIETNILTKRKDFASIPVLRNMIPSQVLLGKSSFNTGKSISAGLPIYARNQVRAIAGLIEGKS